jgi:hypothetical protein
LSNSLLGLTGKGKVSVYEYEAKIQALEVKECYKLTDDVLPLLEKFNAPVMTEDGIYIASKYF